MTNFEPEISKKMKSIVTILLLFLSINANCQKLTKNEIDEFTGEHITETSWTMLRNNGLSDNGQSFFRITRVDSIFYFEFKKGFSKIYTIEEGPVLLLKWEDETVSEMHNIKLTISSEDGGKKGIYNSSRQGVHLKFIAEDDILSRIYNGDVIKKVRLKTDIKDFEEKWGKGKCKKIKKAINLVLHG